MRNYKECARCNNEHNWNLEDYFPLEGIKRLDICLCNSCLEDFKTGRVPRSNFVGYATQANAVLKGK